MRKIICITGAWNKVRNELLEVPDVSDEDVTVVDDEADVLN